MEDEIITNPGAGEAGSGSPAVGGEGQPLSQPNAGDPGEGEQGQGDSRQRGDGGRFAASETPGRPLEELISLGDGVGEMTPAERKAVRISARLGISTQAEVDAHLAKSAPGTPPAAEKPGAATDKNRPGKADPLSTILQAISPNLDPTKPEMAVQSIKELQGKVTSTSERVKELESYYPELENTIDGFLKGGQKGLISMFEAFKIPVPEFLSSGAAAQPAAPAGSQSAPALDLASIKDDDFVSGSHLKGLVASLTNTIATQLKAEFQNEYGPLKDSHGKIVQRITQDAEAEAVKARRTEAFKDIKFHGEFMGQFDPAAKLTADPQAIWDASVVDGKVVAAPHPEWEKLQAAIKFRHDNFIQGKSDAATYKDFLLRQVMDTGKFSELIKLKQKEAVDGKLTAQQRRVQPAVVNAGRGAGGLANLEAKSVADIENMTVEQRREWKANLFQNSK